MMIWLFFRTCGTQSGAPDSTTALEIGICYKTISKWGWGEKALRRIGASEGICDPQTQPADYQQSMVFSNSDFHFSTRRSRFHLLNRCFDSVTQKRQLR